MSVEIVQGTDEHLKEVLEMIHELAEFEKAPEQVTNTVEQMYQEREHFDFFVAIADGEVVGMAIYFFAYFTWVGKSLYLDDLYVKPEFRGRGIASMLISKVFQLANAQGCKRVRWQVLDWNEDAIAVYEKLGSNLDSEWINCDFDREQIAEIANQS